jgi:hypothetical protein
MSFYLDIGYAQLNKQGEELCGDTVEIVQTPDSSIIVLADGLGSGVKANILSRITAKTAATMLKMGGDIEDVIETMIATLPVCKVRNLAYSTFSILQVFRDGRAYLAEFDNPPAYWGYNDSLLHLKKSARLVGGKIIEEAHFKMGEGYWLALVSDGVLHAGLGGIWNLGWGGDRIGSYIKTLVSHRYEAGEIAGKVTAQCNKFYYHKPGDDASVVISRIRKVRKLTVLIGPPRNPDDDAAAVKKLMQAPGVKVVCGGTTGQMVGRILNRKVTVNLHLESDTVPPTGSITGIDLVTEGAVTLYHARQYIKEGFKNLEGVRNGAGRLAKALLKADEIHFIVGTAVNPALYSPDFPVAYAFKHQTVTDIAEILQHAGKKVTVEQL